MDIEKVSSNVMFDGEQLKFKHKSSSLECSMTFSIYLPPQAKIQDVPIIYWLSGLTCSDDNFVQKSGAQKYAAENGVAIVCPDTSPRGDSVPNDLEDSYDLGLGAGFYVNATQDPWTKNYNMYDYVTTELPNVLKNSHLPLQDNNCSIMGHSMGGHGAINIALKNPGKYKSVSAMAPICSLINSPWGQKALENYIGPDRKNWEQYESCLLISKSEEKLYLLIDQGQDDEFLENQLKPELLKEACRRANYPLKLRFQPGYDHSYFFIASFINDHIKHHQEFLF